MAFEINDQHVWVMHRNLETMLPLFVTKYVFIVSVSLVKNQCKNKNLQLFTFQSSHPFFPNFSSLWIFLDFSFSFSKFSIYIFMLIHELCVLW